MVPFVIGLFIGACAAIAILGLMTIYAEDQELQEQARRQRERSLKAKQEREDWYRSYY